MFLATYERCLLAAASLAALGLGLAGCSPGDSSAGPTATVSPATAAASPSDGSSDASRAPTRSAGAPASTAVPQPTQGSVQEKVPERRVVTKEPVSFEEKAAAGRRLNVRLLATEQIQTQARLPGEVSGPGVAITVEVENESTHRVDLDNAVVTLADSKGEPGGLMTGPPAKPMRGSLAQGKKARGVYVFTVPASNRHPLTVFVSVRAGKPVVSFRGTIA